MYRFRRHTKRATATLLALVIAISAVSCLFTGFSAAAFEQSDVTVLNNADGLSQNDSMVSSITTHAQNSPAEGPQVFKAYQPDKSNSGMYNDRTLATDKICDKAAQSCHGSIYQRNKKHCGGYLAGSHSAGFHNRLVVICTSCGSNKDKCTQRNCTHLLMLENKLYRILYTAL